MWTRTQAAERLPFVAAGALLLFEPLRLLLAWAVGADAALALATLCCLTPVVALHRWAGGPRSARRALFEGLAFTLVVLLVYWLVFVRPVPQVPWPR